MSLSPYRMSEESNDLEKYRLEWESDDQWKLRKSFIIRHWGEYANINRLICLSQIFINVEFLGCRYNPKVMNEVVALSEGLSDHRREERKKVIEKTFVKGGQLKQELQHTGVVVSCLTFRGKELQPANEKANRKKLCTVGLGSLMSESRQIYESDDGILKMKAADEEITTDDLVKSELAKDTGRGIDLDDSVEELPTKSNSQTPDVCTDCQFGTCSMSPDLISKFIIKHGVHESISLESAKGILVRSADFSAVNYTFDTSLDQCGYRSKLLISDANFFLSENVCNSIRQAEAEASLSALKKLKQHCFTIMQKGQIDKCQKEIGKDLVEEEEKCTTGAASQYPKIDSSNVGKKLLEKMGWSGGGIGKKEQGIREPISVQKIFAREGLGRAASCGAGKGFTQAIESILRDYVYSDQQDDLVFASDFSNVQRKLIHQLCRKMNLKSISYGQDSDRQLTVQKKKTAQQLLLFLLENNGENGKFLVVPPGYY